MKFNNVPIEIECGDGVGSCPMKGAGIDDSTAGNPLIVWDMGVAMEDVIGTRIRQCPAEFGFVAMKNLDRLLRQFKSQGDLLGRIQADGAQIRTNSLVWIVGVAPYESAMVSRQLVKDLHTADVAAMDDLIDIEPVEGF